MFDLLHVLLQISSNVATEATSNERELRIAIERPGFVIMNLFFEVRLDLFYSL